MDEVLPGEKEYLASLAGFSCLDERHPVLDGAALVFEIDVPPARAELVLEVRLPGHKNTQDNGTLLALLTNVADVPLSTSVPEFILTGGLRLPWKAGITIFFNEVRGEMGEALSWRAPFVWNEDRQMIAEDFRRILDKGSGLASERVCQGSDLSPFQRPK